MRVPRIHVTETLTADDDLTLTDAPAHYLSRVLRMQPGQSLVLFNGDGQDYPARITETTKSRVRVRVAQGAPVDTESPLPVTLAQVISRGDRMDYVIQKSVEMGVTRIQPLTSERCEVKLQGQREEKRLRHWQQVAVSAAEQCGRAIVPDVQPLMSLQQWLSQTEHSKLCLVLHHRSSTALDTLPAPESLTLLVGPEGGLNDDEIETAEAAGFISTTLGPRVMRTETAPVSALAVCQWLWGDLNARQ